MGAHPVGDSRPALHPPPNSMRRYAIAAALAVIVIASGAVSWCVTDIHLPSTAAVTSRRVIVLQSDDGQQLFHKGNLQLAPVDVKDTPPVVIDAVLSIEDRRFYHHSGVDWLSVMRALKQNIEADKIVAGGSTITQQLVKTLFVGPELVGPERTYRRKVQKAAIAIWLEHHLTKDQSLTSYLNNVYLGSGTVGFPAAAKLYFGKKVSDLSLPETAMLAGMIVRLARTIHFTISTPLAVEPRPCLMRW